MPQRWLHIDHHEVIKEALHQSAAAIDDAIDITFKRSS
jgi:hypothetical protein